MAGLPKRCGNTRKKETRNRSWVKGQTAKQARIKEQNEREAANAHRGYTGKQADDVLRRVHGTEYRAFKKGLLNY
jgi:hypothetical protein